MKYKIRLNCFYTYNLTVRNSVFFLLSVVETYVSNGTIAIVNILEMFQVNFYDIKINLTKSKLI